MGQDAIPDVACYHEMVYSFNCRFYPFAGKGKELDDVTAQGVQTERVRCTFI